jgi:plasmid stabilization system protein ParE
MTERGPFPVLVDPHAAEDIERIDACWNANRDAAPNLFADEVADALALLATSPAMGHGYKRRSIPGLRRFLLRASRHHVYYVFDGSTVVILSVWSFVRRRGANLPR